MASSLGMALLLRVLVRTIKSSARAAGSRLTHCSNTLDETAEDFEPFVAAEAVIRGYDTPELYNEDRMARLERSMGDKQPS